jgi:hypothetical protein
MQTHIHEVRLQTQTEEWMAKFDEHCTHACTLTFKQEVGGNKVTAELAWLYWENFCKYLNRVIYKHAAKNHNKSLLILPVMHGELKNERLHFHCAIGCVDKDYSFDKLKAIINKAWRDMKWTENETEIKPYINVGWHGYMLKESVRMDLNSVDITRCFIPPTLKAKILS